MSIQSIGYNPNFVQKAVSFRATTPNDVSNLQTKKKQESMSTGAKLGIGFGLTALAAIGIYAATRGKIGNTKQIYEHIDFTPAKTLEEARKFAKNKLGMIINDSGEKVSLDVLNYVNEGLTTLKNSGKVSKNPVSWLESSSIGGGYDAGSLAQVVGTNDRTLYGIRISSDYVKNLNKILDKFIRGEIDRGALVKIDGLYKYNDFFAKTDISKDTSELINNFLKNNNSLSFKDKVKLHLSMQDIGETMDRLWIKTNGDINKVPNLIKIQTSPFHPIWHEVGHIEHERKVGAEVFSKMDQLSILKQKGIDDSIFKEFSEKHINTVAKVSDYAQESPVEFVAEVYAKLCNGEKFSDDVMALYKKYNGPII